MHVGILKIKLHLPLTNSLKGKRSIVQSTSSQIRNRFQVAVAEVDKNELWQIAVIGVVCVSNASRHSNQVLDSVLQFVYTLPVEIIESQTDVISGF